MYLKYRYYVTIQENLGEIDNTVILITETITTRKAHFL